MTPGGLEALTVVGLPAVVGSVLGAALGHALGAAADRLRTTRRPSRRFMVARLRENPARKHDPRTIRHARRAATGLGGPLSGSFGPRSVDLSGFPHEDRSRSGRPSGQKKRPDWGKE